MFPSELKRYLPFPTLSMAEANILKLLESARNWAKYLFELTWKCHVKTSNASNRIKVSSQLTCRWSTSRYNSCLLQIVTNLKFYSNILIQLVIEHYLLNYLCRKKSMIMGFDDNWKIIFLERLEHFTLQSKFMQYFIYLAGSSLNWTHISWDCGKKLNHPEKTYEGTKLNPQPSFCCGTVLITAPPCHPKTKTHTSSFHEKRILPQQNEFNICLTWKQCDRK